MAPFRGRAVGLPPEASEFPLGIWPLASSICRAGFQPAARQIAVANHRELVTPPSRTARGAWGISAVTDLAGLDVSIFRALNDFCGWSPTLDRIVVHLDVLKGSLFLGLVGVL